VRVLATLALIALAVGCRGSDAGRPSPDEFAERTNAICRDAIRGSFVATDQTTQQWRKRLEHNHQLLKRFRNLRPPGGLDQSWTTVLAASERLYRANIELFATSPRPAIGSKQWRRAKREADAAVRQIRQEAAELPLGPACRSGL
jgi:hypothetical protein